MPRFVPPMLPSLVAEPPSGTQWVHELKIDGYRIQAHCSNGTCRLLTRQGIDWTDRFGQVAKALAPLSQKGTAASALMLDGEIAVVDAEGRSDFSALQQYLKRPDPSRSTLAYFAFDLLQLGDEAIRDRPLLWRKDRLREQIEKALDPRLQYLNHVADRGDALLQQCRALKLEGIVSKRVDRPYRSGRTLDWLKCKYRFRELFVIGGVEVDSASGLLSSLLTGYFESDGAFTFAGRVGTGWSQSEADDLLRRAEKSRQAATPFPQRVPEPAARRSADLKVTWLRPQHVVEVSFSGWTHGNVLRQPAWLSLAPKHPAKEVTAQSIFGDQAALTSVSSDDGRSVDGKAAPAATSVAAAKKPSVDKPLAKRRGKSLPESLRTASELRLTNPERVLYPEEGITKEQLVGYLLQVCQWMLPHLSGRPVSLVRCPEGIEGSHYFQRHPQRGFPTAIKPVTIPGEEKQYLAIGSAEALVAVGQMSVLELHPWGCRTDRLDRPDRLIFDLDPDPSVPWRKVSAAAVEIRQRLIDCGMASWLKTTGGKGLHIVVPLVRRYSWERVLKFAEKIATEMAADQPQAYVATMSKAARKNRIYIDYHRNHPHATAVGAYSPRARPGAPIATPIAWDELPLVHAGDQFTLENLPQRLRSLTADPWADLDSAPQTLPR